MLRSSIFFIVGIFAASTILNISIAESSDPDLFIKSPKTVSDGSLSSVLSLLSIEVCNFDSHSLHILDNGLIVLLVLLVVDCFTHFEQ